MSESSDHHTVASYSSPTGHTDHSLSYDHHYSTSAHTDHSSSYDHHYSTSAAGSSDHHHSAVNYADPSNSTESGLNLTGSFPHSTAAAHAVDEVSIRIPHVPLPHIPSPVTIPHIQPPPLPHIQPPPSNFSHPPALTSASEVANFERTHSHTSTVEEVMKRDHLTRNQAEALVTAVEHGMSAEALFRMAHPASGQGLSEADMHTALRAVMPEEQAKDLAHYYSASDVYAKTGSISDQLWADRLRLAHDKPFAEVARDMGYLHVNNTNPDNYAATRAQQDSNFVVEAAQHNNNGRLSSEEIHKMVQQTNGIVAAENLGHLGSYLHANGHQGAGEGRAEVALYGDGSVSQHQMGLHTGSATMSASAAAHLKAAYDASGQDTGALRLALFDTGSSADQALALSHIAPFVQANGAVNIAAMHNAGMSDATIQSYLQQAGMTHSAAVNATNAVLHPPAPAHAERHLSTTEQIGQTVSNWYHNTFHVGW